jgi:hypothetical protein
MSDRRDRPADPFAPADLPDLASDLELADRPAPPPRPAATLAEAPRPAVSARTPVAYKQPDGGVGTYIIWALALVGVGAGVVFGARFLRRGVEAPVAAAPAKAAPPAPVHWQALGHGDDVLISVELQPRLGREARLLLDGAPLPSNPVALPRGSRHVITAMAEGYAAADLDVTADAAKSVKLRLEKAR